MQKENQHYNIQPADRLASVSEYYFSRKLKEVAKMNAEGKDVISLLRISAGTHMRTENVAALKKIAFFCSKCYNRNIPNTKVGKLPCKECDFVTEENHRFATIKAEKQEGVSTMKKRNTQELKPKKT